MDEYSIYRYIEFVIFMLYLIFIFLSIQIWLMFKDIDLKEWDLKSTNRESFFKKNLIYIIFASIFFLIHEFLEGITFPNAFIYFEFFEVLALISLVLFAYSWYKALRPLTHKASLLGFVNFNRYKQD